MEANVQEINKENELPNLVQNKEKKLYITDPTNKTPPNQPITNQSNLILNKSNLVKQEKLEKDKKVKMYKIRT